MSPVVAAGLGRVGLTDFLWEDLPARSDDANGYRSDVVASMRRRSSGAPYLHEPYGVGRPTPRRYSQRALRWLSTHGLRRSDYWVVGGIVFDDPVVDEIEHESGVIHYTCGGRHYSIITKTPPPRRRRPAPKPKPPESRAAREARRRRLDRSRTSIARWVLIDLGEDLGRPPWQSDLVYALGKPNTRSLLSWLGFKSTLKASEYSPLLDELWRQAGYKGRPDGRAARHRHKPRPKTPKPAPRTQRVPRRRRLDRSGLRAESLSLVMKRLGRRRGAIVREYMYRHRSDMSSALIATSPAVVATYWWQLLSSQTHRR